MIYMEYLKHLQYRMQTSRFMWRFYRWYSTKGKYKMKIGGASPLKKTIKNNITIWPTNVCNAMCIFCSKRKLVLKPKIMGMKLYKKAIDQIYELGNDEIGLNPIIGEVLVDKHLSQKIKYAKNKGMKVSFFTNGILFAKNNNYKKVIDAGTDVITISVGDIDEDYDSKIYGISREVSNERWTGIFKLLQYAKSKNSNIKILISFRPIRPPNQITNNKKFKSIRLFPNATISFLMCYDNWGGKIIQDDLSGIMLLKKGAKKKGICASLYDAVVMPDGKVRLCNCRIKDKENDDLVIGDILVSNLTEILNNPKVIKIREEFMKGIYPEVCVNCTLFRQAKLNY